MNLPQLNLPPIDARIRESPEGLMIYDRIRKKFVALGPEEWVRQHFIHLLIDQLHYPASLMKSESGLVYHKNLKRSDILVYGRDGKPFLLVECKAPGVNPGEDTVRQVAEYNKILQARFVAVSNGLRHLVWRWDGDGYEPLTEFPRFETASDDR
jgi:hypothetical protein